jgi:hypothetical protein
VFPRARVARVGLDRARSPRVRYVARDGSSGSKLDLELRRARPQVIELQAFSRRRRVAWTARLTLRSGDDRGTVEVDDGGRPFRVTSVRSAHGYEPRFGATGIAGFRRRPAWDGGVGRCSV